ncbi:MAG TPA: hypothetical protein ENH87_08390 [Pricia antarctica]|uniref:Sulfatase N-terminal domain-containing protein n=1 Tax=Pricia antarctica TaxID=641691 RepID=A0A831QQ43_9FLAO|nr:hypothetical protein [Pricia antarctica]
MDYIKNKCHFCALLLLILVLLSLSCKRKETNSKTAVVFTDVVKPNFINFLVDDLGYAQVGAYGHEKIETPNIDALSANGILFIQHYSSAPVCSAAQYILLTGKHAGNAFI